MTTKVPLWLTANVPVYAADELAKALALPRRVASWLVARNISTVQEARRFLYAHEQFSDPFDYQDMRVAVERILESVDNDELIVIVGDYDVDGVTASTILAAELETRRARWHCLIPERVTDGYGLSASLVDRAHEMGASLIVTVDNGIRADEALERCSRLGVDVIVTDHHEPGSSPLPGCVAVVHWSRHERPNDAIVLSGAGVAWKVCQALQALREISQAPSDHREWLMGLAAVGAISDIMPMRGENRRLIREGLAALRGCRRPGWLALCERARVVPDELSATSISWRIAPRMNAAGRMASATAAFELLMADKRPKAGEYADEIERLNAERKRSTDEAVLQAKAQVQEIYGHEEPGAIVVAGEWPLGVVGIVAAKLSDLYQCPAIVLSDMGTDILRGSGRSPAGISIHDALMSCESSLDHFGGHDAAVGCGVRKDKVGEFRLAFREAVRAIGAVQKQEAAVVADDFLPLEEATLDMLDWTLKFSPYGPENEPLRFFIGPAVVTKLTPLGDGSHVRLRLQEGAVEADAVWFQAPERMRDKSLAGQRMALVVELEENVWQGRRKAQLRVVDGWVLRKPVVREVFARVYRHLLQGRVVPETAFDQLAKEHHIDDLDVILETFVELGFAACENGAYHVLEAVRPRDLREAVSYQAHLRTQLVELT